MARGLATTVLAILMVLASAPATIAQQPPATSVALDGTPGEFITGGQSYRHDRTNAVIRASYGNGYLLVTVRDTQHWYGRFYAPADAGRLAPGRYAFKDTRGADEWSGHGRGCNRAVGWFEITHIEYAHNELIELVMTFAQRCEEAQATFRGSVSWAAATASPVIQNPQPAPADLWRPPAGAIPAKGNVVYFESTAGDWVGAGTTRLFQPENGKTFPVTAYEGELAFRMYGTEYWSGHFSAPILSGFLQRAYYGGVNRWPFDSPLLGGLSFSGEGRGCNRLYGWFVIDRLDKIAGKPRAFTLRFEQRCDSPTAPPLHGYIRWRRGLTETGFTDIVGHRYEWAMNAVAKQGWMPGYDDSTFRPRKHVTRGQIADYIVAAKGWGPPSDDAPDFSDIADSPHRDAIRRLAQSGYVTGFKDGTYRPDLTISRGGLARLIQRTSISFTPQPHDRFFFDVLGTPFDTGVRALMSQRIVWPTGSGRYHPDAGATRAHTAMVLARALGGAPVGRG